MAAVLDRPASTLSIRRLQPNIGAEIAGVDLTQPLSQADRDAIWQALLDHHVIFFRDQFLDRDQHLAFARAFGDPVVDAKTVGTHAEIQPVRSGIGGDYVRAAWHADATYRDNPFFASILLAHEVPPLGGDTLFSSAKAAYDGLEPELRQRIEGLHAVHTGEGKANALFKTDAERDAYLDKFSGAVHPVVIRHPHSGEKLLYVSNGFAKRFVEIEGPEADALLADLKYRFTYPEYQVRFQWQPGSIAFWDNRAVQHHGVGDYGDHYRYFERIVLAGPPPAA
ncbi:TauD/TfdA family dioxygenase [Sphingobium sp. HBC34]|uniref:TauD/TfdA family dioxygenase n=1 Tax=Sphingobium cyanobacteriorum TaxID=3063954 RepID=A0ABT8ZM55_9SPHN|nr:TauD/TfdA family dioxygenase [Sphingobium sp. HBC34]MDO7835632.1 TauD/TfdA family dioxygenase [Sphingobium sp. HBC34]